MKKMIFACLDVKASAFGNPFTSTNRGTAIRDFANAVRDTGSQVNKNPEDFMLYEIGSFDDSVGLIEAYNVPEVIAHGTQFTQEV